jgi:hypothetical protein
MLGDKESDRFSQNSQSAPTLLNEADMRRLPGNRGLLRGNLSHKTAPVDPQGRFMRRPPSRTLLLRKSMRLHHKLEPYIPAANREIRIKRRCLDPDPGTYGTVVEQFRAKR